MGLVFEERKIEEKPNLSFLALTSFVISFAVARAFTILSPNIIVFTAGVHIHHFWYGILMLAIGGWLGISYSDPRIDRIAAILFGAGGGLIGDEIGILLTFESNNYWAGISYTFVIILVVLFSLLAILNKYRQIILKEFGEFSSSRGGFYFVVFLAATSIAFLIDTDNPLVIAITGILTAVAFLCIVVFLIQKIRLRLIRRRTGS